jgi:UDP-N-acetylglucosamine acyltransferase
VATIHPTAIVSSLAELGQDVEIGPYCVIEPDVRIGNGCRLEARVSIKSRTTLGEGNEIGEGAVLGGRAQHLQNGKVGGALVVGNHNRIREFVTMHTGFKPDDCTIVGNNNMFMVASHVAHDCVVGDYVVVVNNALLGGHVKVGNRAFISGAVAVHQLCRVGAYAIVGAVTKIVKDVPPYCMVDGSPAVLVGLNKVGLRRANFSVEDMQQLKDAYRLIYGSITNPVHDWPSCIIP